MSLFRVERRDAVASGSPTYNPFENPAVPLASVGLDQIFGRENSDAGVNVTPQDSISLPIVYRCVSLLSTVVASCPLEVWKEPDKEPVRIKALDRFNTLTTYTQYELWELVVTYLSLWGNAYVLKVRDGNGKIYDLKPVFPGLVKVKIDSDGNKVFLIKRVNADGTLSTELPQVFTTWEIMHIPGLGYDGLIGLSPIQAAAQTVGTAVAGDKLAGRFYKSGSALTGVVKVKAPLRSQVQAEGIKARWAQSHGGVGNMGSVAVLDAETDFQPLTIPPDQLQFLESRRWQTTEIARLFGIPPHLVGDVEKSTSWGTGIEQQNIGFVAYTIAGITNRIEQRVTREIVNTRGHCAEFELDRLMRGSMTERFGAYMEAAGGPWMTRNEVRLAENRPPIPGGDKLLPPPGIAPQPPPQQQNPAQPGSREERDAAGGAYQQLSRDYPPSAMTWMLSAQWAGPLTVPPDHIRPDMKWLDRADPHHVEDFVDRIHQGKKLKPVLLVKTPSDDKLKLVDGHHRYLAALQEDIPVRAYIATVDTDHGPWEMMHDQQIDGNHR